jgi:hypothetical protein
MAEKKVYLGSMGPYLFDDGDLVDDPDGDWNGEDVVGVRSDSPFIAPEFRGIPISSVSVTDIDDPSTELNALSATLVGGLIAVYQVSAGADDEFTLYLFDTDAAAENVPYSVDGTGGTWIAVGGKYRNGDVYVEGSVNIGGSLEAHTHTESNITDLDHTDTVAVHDDDFSSNGVMIRTGSGVYTNVLGEDTNTSFNVVVDIQAGGAGGIGFQFKTRAITIDDGVITDVGNESGWSDI